MFAVRIDLLSGRYAASRYNDRDRAEWPPHPARFFSALVAAYAEHEPTSAEGSEERRALEWLEAQAAPVVVADVLSEASGLGRRTVSTVFVPVNDVVVIAQPDKQRADLSDAEVALASADARARVKAAKALQKAAEALAKRTAVAIEPVAKPAAALVDETTLLLPEGRKKQARTFPSITPPNAEVELRWPASTLPTELDAPMRRLLSRVARIGHSSSFVATRVVDGASAVPPDRLHEPREEGDSTLRWVSPGQTERLVGYHAQHQQVEPRVMPCVFVRYASTVEPAPVTPQGTVFDDAWLVLSRVDGPRLPITSTVGVARLLNRALQSAVGTGGQPVPEVLSGHKSDGTRSEQPHVAIVPLPFVGAPHADGNLMGVAIVLPRAIHEADRKEILRALGSLERDGRLALHLGDSGEWGLERVGWEPPRAASLRADTWTRASREWLTATPIALDENPGDLRHADVSKRARAFEEAEASVAVAAERIGLPRPVSVEVSRSVLLPGAAKPRHHPRFPPLRQPSQSDKPQRVLVHARLVFRDPVRGPMLLGAGRYLGLGLCRPVRGGGR